MAERLPETYGGFSDILASPALSHLTAYNIPPAPKSTALSAKTPVARNKPQPVTSPMAVEVSGTGLEASLGFNQSVSLTGKSNSPATQPGANNPGLDNQAEGETVSPGGINMHWAFIALIVVVVLALLWYYNPGNILARG